MTWLMQTWSTADEENQLIQTLPAKTLHVTSREAAQEYPDARQFSRPKSVYLGSRLPHLSPWTPRGPLLWSCFERRSRGILNQIIAIFPSASLRDLFSRVDEAAGKGSGYLWRIDIGATDNFSFIFFTPSEVQGIGTNDRGIPS